MEPKFSMWQLNMVGNRTVGFIKAFKSYYGFSPSLLYAMKLEIMHFGGGDMNNCNFYKIMDGHLSKEELFKVLHEKIIEHGYDNQKLNNIYNFVRVYMEAEKDIRVMIM